MKCPECGLSDYMHYGRAAGWCTWKPTKGVYKMTNKDSFTERAQAEIVDSLEDIRESFEADMEALGDGSAYEVAAHLAYVNGSVLYRFNDGEELSRGDLQMIDSALDRSIEVCADLGDDLDEASAEYEAAQVEVRNFL